MVLLPASTGSWSTAPTILTAEQVHLAPGLEEILPASQIQWGEATATTCQAAASDRSHHSQELKTPVTAYGALWLQTTDPPCLHVMQCLGSRKSFSQSLVFLSRCRWNALQHTHHPNRHLRHAPGQWPAAGYKLDHRPQVQHPSCPVEEQFIYFSVVLGMIGRFLHFTKLSTSGRNDELTSTCKMPFLEVSYLSPAPHYVQVSGNQRPNSIQASSLPDLRHAKSAPCFFEAAGSFQESVIPLTQIWLEKVLDKHRVISRDWQTDYLQ